MHILCNSCLVFILHFYILVQTYIQRHLRTPSYKNSRQTTIIHLFTTKHLYNYTYILHLLKKTFVVSFINTQKGSSHFPLSCTNYVSPLQVPHYIVGKTILLKGGIPCLLYLNGTQKSMRRAFQFSHSATLLQ